MVNLLQTGRTWLTARQQESASVSVVIGRGGSTTTVSAVLGRNGIEQDNGDGTFTRYEGQDFLISVDDYAFADTVTEPQAIDTITYGDKVYVALAIGGEPHARYSDQSQTVWRIHTKLRSDGDDEECLLTENQLRAILGVLPVTC